MDYIQNAYICKIITDTLCSFLCIRINFLEHFVSFFHVELNWNSVHKRNK